MKLRYKRIEKVMPVDEVLKRIANTRTTSDTALLQELINALRPQSENDIDQAADRLRALCFVLSCKPEHAIALRKYLTAVVSSRKMVHLYTDTGITSNIGFWSAAWQRMIYKILPPMINDVYLRDVFGQLFQRDDYQWIHAVDEEIWLDLINALHLKINRARTHQNGMLNELLTAIQVLSYRISAIGLEAELVRNYPDIERYESPFLRQNNETNDFVTEYRQWLFDRSVAHRDSRHIEVLLAQCEEVVVKIRRTALSQGVSISLTRLLLRVTESIARLRALLALIEASDRKQVLLTGFRLFKELVYADNRKYSINQLIETNTHLLTMQITEHAGRSGEHYVAGNRREWLEMFHSASGAGFIVGFMAMVKILTSQLPLAPFGFAFLYSLNYSFGFMLVHVLHFTIATKQPAMTAALIAKSLDKNKKNLEDLCELVVQVMRTQFIAILGNVMLAMPTAYAIAWTWYGLFGHHMVNPVKANHLLEEINPLASLSLFHAAIAGVCLFLSGLISGYYDNKSNYSHIPQRLMQISTMSRWFGPSRWQRITDYIGDNLGALTGNFFFGVMLGSIGQIGVFLGLPIDIRHITFSSANFVFALVGLDQHLSWQVWAISLLGIALIGIVNLSVSFSLALLVAMRSRQVSFEQTRELAWLLWRRFTTRGRDFFFPPPDEPWWPT